MRLTSVGAALQVSVHSWAGSGLIGGGKQRVHRWLITEIVDAMNEHFRNSSAPTNLTTCIFYMVLGILLVIVGIRMLLLFQNIM